MKRLEMRLFLAAMALAASTLAEAAITCNFSSPGWSAAYVPANAATNITQSSFTVTCQRNAGGDPTTVNYTVASDNGLHAAAAQNRAQLAATANRINYEDHSNSTCSSVWANAVASRIAGTISGLAGFIPSSQTVSYWGCIPGSQIGLPAGTYTDAVTMTLRYGGATNPTATFPVSIVTPASCTITTVPGAMAFTYTAFGPVQNLSTPFGVTCTNLLPYTMALDSTVNVAVGLQYTLALSAPGGTGTGLAQPYTVNGTMPAGQAGTCAGANCGVTQVRTLTITY
ncbi:MAG TPA: spore coat protein U domain-containing protein [Usitatibacter sp.]